MGKTVLLAFCYFYEHEATYLPHLIYLTFSHIFCCFFCENTSDMKMHRRQALLFSHVLCLCAHSWMFMVTKHWIWAHLDSSSCILMVMCVTSCIQANKRWTMKSFFLTISLLGKCEKNSVLYSWKFVLYNCVIVLLAFVASSMEINKWYYFQRASWLFILVRGCLCDIYS